MKSIAIPVILILALFCSCSSKRIEETSQQPSAETGKNYIGHSREECARIQVQCLPGFERFDDEKGCGCRKKETP